MTGALALRLEGLRAWYGASQVLHGVELSVAPGEVVTLLGRNGAGRTSTLRALMGLIVRRGMVQVKGIDASALAPHHVARLGVGYCPEERGVFASLSTRENLLLPPVLPGCAGMAEAEIDVLFPQLRARAETPGARLSGGEQQMLAIARILRTGAKLLLLDEISEGLAPVVVQQLARTILDLKGRGYTVLMVEQNFRFAAPLGDRFYVMERGRIVDQFSAAELSAQCANLHKLLGV